MDGAAFFTPKHDNTWGMRQCLLHVVRLHHQIDDWFLKPKLMKLEKNGHHKDLILSDNS